MTQEKLTIAMIEEYGKMRQRKQVTRLICPCCGKGQIKYSTSELSCYPPTHVCRVCADSDTIPAEQWAIAQYPELWGMLEKFDFHVGEYHSKREGYVEIEATSWIEAEKIFHSAYPEEFGFRFDYRSLIDKAQLHYYGRIKYRDSNIPHIPSTQDV